MAKRAKERRGGRSRGREESAAARFGPDRPSSFSEIGLAAGRKPIQPPEPNIRDDSTSDVVEHVLS